MFPVFPVEYCRSLRVLQVYRCSFLFPELAALIEDT